LGSETNLLKYYPNILISSWMSHPRNRSSRGDPTAMDVRAPELSRQLSAFIGGLQGCLAPCLYVYIHTYIFDVLPSPRVCVCLYLFPCVFVNTCVCVCCSIFRFQQIPGRSSAIDLQSNIYIYTPTCIYRNIRL